MNEKLKKDILNALADDHSIDITEVELEFNPDNIFLRGTVDNLQTKEIIESIVRATAQNHAVFNELKIRSSPPELDIISNISPNLERDVRFKIEKLP
jgi:osmotically-inducible protein OsmY